MTSSAAIWDKLENLPRPTLGELFSAVRDGGEGADEPGGAERVAMLSDRIELGEGGKVLGIEEKPAEPKSNYAVTGLYFYDGKASEYAKTLKPSHRGELEITALNQVYLDAGELNVELLGRGFAWLDTGTHDSLIQAGELIRTLELRQGLRIGCIEEVAYSKGFIDRQQLADLGRAQAKGEYGQYLIRLAERMAPGAEPAE